MYSEDAYTLGKTSLVKTTHGFPPKYRLPFHQVEFTSIDTVPLISFDSEDPPEANPPATTAEDVQPASQPPRSLNNSVHSQQQILSSGSSSHSNREGSGSGPPASAPSSHTSHSASNPAGNSAQSPSEPDLAKTTVSYPPEPSTYDESKASYEHDWERAPSQNNYTPPVCTTPWGFEPEQDVSENIGGPLNATPREDQRVPRQNYARASAPPKPRQNSRPTPKPHLNITFNGASKKVPTSFKGSWDDLVLGNTEDIAATPLSPSALSPGSEPHEFAGLGDVALNRFGERVDLPLPPAAESDKSRLRARSKDRKLCNEHHLKRACHNEQCRYDHEGPIDAGLLLALRHLARTQACDVGLRCRMPGCCYGHHCPNRVGGRECKSANCSFKKMSLHHIRDLKVAEIIPSPRK
jgi:hypothetical protein